VVVKRADCYVWDGVLEIILWMNLNVPLIRSGVIFFAECSRRDARYLAHLFISLAYIHKGRDAGLPVWICHALKGTDRIDDIGAISTHPAIKCDSCAILRSGPGYPEK
jgi:hypothetical protein